MEHCLKRFRTGFLCFAKRPTCCSEVDGIFKSLEQLEVLHRDQSHTSLAPPGDHQPFAAISDAVAQLGQL